MQIRQLEEQLSTADAEKDHLMSERSEHHEALDMIRVNITSLTEERDELQERVEDLERDNSQLKKHLEETTERVRKSLCPSFCFPLVDKITV